ncbi:porin family protein [Thioalkalivibrio sp. ALJ15]|uniref:porin family protein n=1 Tax=Thioalkalivibrio sp. ALJ15 TaxID=748652 RepID=UPI0003A4950D|nr:porin family protein [Thioalkalivibrio sp. ALJ15]
MKRYLAAGVAVSALVLFGSQSALGQQDRDRTTQERDRTTGLYMGLGTGFSSLKNDSDEVADFIGSGTSDYSIDDDDNVWRGFVGYNFNRYLAVEGFYTDLGEVHLRGDQDGAHSSVRSTAYGASVLGKLPIGSYVEAFAKVGAAKWDADVRGNLGDEGRTLRSQDGFDPVYGVGMQVNLNAFMIRAEYERYDFDSDYKMDAFTASLGWRF